MLALVAPETSINGLASGIALMEPTAIPVRSKFKRAMPRAALPASSMPPARKLYLQDSGGDKSGGISLTTDLIVGTLFDKTATLTINSYSLSHPTTPLKVITLVE